MPRFILFAGLSLFLFGQAVLMPAAQSEGQAMDRLKWEPEHSRKAEVQAAIDWMKRQVHSGKFVSERPRAQALQQPISIIAWRDPTFHPRQPEILAGYTLTDTLWAAKAMQFHAPEESQDLLRSLNELDSLGNGLQEVLFGAVTTFGHRVVDPDHVHGTTIGRIRLEGGRQVFVQRFQFKPDPEFTRGHTRLFAEHLAYQAMQDYWQGETQLARQRLQDLFRPSETVDQQTPIHWDSKRRLLLDLGNIEAWRKEPVSAVDQYPIKLGTVLYAMKLTGLDREFSEECRAIEQRLWQSQWPEQPPELKDQEGGVAHWFRVHPDGRIQRGRGATAEATAIAVLNALLVSETATPRWAP